jgi:hypothetical protein
MLSYLNILGLPKSVGKNNKKAYKIIFLLLVIKNKLLELI